VRDLKCTKLESHVQGSFVKLFEFQDGIYWKNGRILPA
jgi:hypothetical protein